MCPEEDCISCQLCLANYTSEGSRHCSPQSWCRVDVLEVTPETATCRVPGFSCDCSCFWSCLPSALSCHGCVPGFFVHCLLGLCRALMMFPLRTPLAWRRWRQFYWYSNLETLRAYMLYISHLSLRKGWKYFSIDNNNHWQVTMIWIHQSYKNV